MPYVQGSVTVTEARFDLPVTTSIVSFARDMAAAMLRLWGMPHLVEDARLVTSELVTNAVKATVASRDLQSEIILTVRRSEDGSHVIFSIWNIGSVVPQLPAMPPELSSQSGRGLVIVEQLCDHFDAKRVDGGVELYCTLLAA
jgi:anti-sigma regulatory factor (Ser/Thr protein kinase)